MIPVRKPVRAARTATAAAVLAGALLTAGCSGEDPEPASPSSDPSGTAEGGEALAVTTKVGKVSGRIAPKDARRTAGWIADVADGWFEAAYLAGEYPRGDFANAFPGFTGGARADATKDGALMTNRAIGRDVEAVSAEVKQVTVDMVAANRRAAGATARFTLVFSTEGTYAKQVTVKGRLFLTKDKTRKWRVFGYDVIRSSK